MRYKLPMFNLVKLSYLSFAECVTESTIRCVLQIIFRSIYRQLANRHNIIRNLVYRGKPLKIRRSRILRLQRGYQFAHFRQMSQTPHKYQIQSSRMFQKTSCPYFPLKEVSSLQQTKIHVKILTHDVTYAVRAACCAH